MGFFLVSFGLFREWLDDTPKAIFLSFLFGAFCLHQVLSLVLGFKNVKCLVSSNIFAQQGHICMHIYAWMPLLFLMFLALCSAVSKEILPSCLLGKAEEKAYVNIFPCPVLKRSRCQLNSRCCVYLYHSFGKATAHRQVLQLAGLSRSAYILKLYMDRWLSITITRAGVLHPASQEFEWVSYLLHSFKLN